MDRNQTASKTLEVLMFYPTSFSYYQNKTNTKLIYARLQEGFTYEDFCYVIDIKCFDWVGTNFDAVIDNNHTIDNLYLQLQSVVQ